MNVAVEHTMRKETYGDYAGREIAVTVCRYVGEDGFPRCASLHGHLHPQIAGNMIKAFRSAAARQVTA